VAAEGAVVVIPTWPVLEAEPDEDAAARTYRAQAIAVVCSLRFARRVAVQWGGDPDDLTLLGHSGGGMVGAAVALVDPPPWNDITCDPEWSAAPQRFIGLAGDYTGTYQEAIAFAEEFRPYAPWTVRPTNRDLTVRMIHGTHDDSIDASSSSDFVDHLDGWGVDASLLLLDAGHGELIAPDTAAGAFVASEVAAIVRGTPGEFGAAADATGTVVFDGARCEYSGPPSVAVGDRLDLTLHNTAGMRSAFALIAVADGVPLPSMEPGGPTVPVWEVPTWVDGSGFQMVEGPDETYRWRIVDGGVRWIVFCVPAPEPPDAHPRADVAYAAATRSGDLAVVVAGAP
jgi:predicted esterase